MPKKMLYSKRVLLFGHDELLLTTRLWSLQEYFEVEVATNLDAVDEFLEDGPFDLVILCHTAFPHEDNEVFHAVWGRSASTCFISLHQVFDQTAPARNPNVYEPVDALLSVMMRRVLEILRPPTA